MDGWMAIDYTYYQFGWREPSRLYVVGDVDRAEGRL